MIWCLFWAVINIQLLTVGGSHLPVQVFNAIAAAVMIGLALYFRLTKD